MGKSLVIAEKPSVGKDIAKVLGCQIKGNHAESNKYIVTWAFGHLVTLASPDKYNKAYDTWTLDNLPMLPSPFKLEIIRQSSKQYSLVRKLMERQDVSDIIIATDAGREGELVARWIIDYAHVKKPIKRLWISSVTDKAIKEGFSKLVDGHKYDHLYAAARARAKADWIVGLNGTRALTVKHNASLSMGRVQTPTLGLVIEQEHLIRNFKPETYFELSGKFEGIHWRYVDKANQSRIKSQEQVNQIVKVFKGSTGIISKLEIKDKKTYPQGLYDLTELQRDANRMYGFSAKETLNAMQMLYERHKVLTYPRTDSKYLTSDIVGTLLDRVKACRNSQYKEAVSLIIKTPIKANKSFVDSSKVGDHHAIIPTEQVPFYNDFGSREMKIYNLVVSRFLAVLLPPYQYKEVAVELQVKDKGQIYRLVGKQTFVTDYGYQKVLKSKDSRDENQEIASKDLTKIKKGQMLSILNLNAQAKKTSPPAYLSEGELLHEMEKAGLGTVATRADIIEKILDNHYVEKSNQQLRSTKTGRQLIELVPEDIRSKTLTAKWEKDLEAIAKGQKSEDQFLGDMILFTKRIITEIKADKQEFKHENVSSEKCPECGKNLLILENKHGKRLVCSDRSCGYKKNIAMTTNARCPECRKKLNLVGEGDNKTFVCRCGFKEKLSAFEKRKESHNKQMNKREVQNYMNKSSKKEEVFNNPFASLLGDLDKKDKE